MHDVEKRELDAILAAAMVVARVLERYEASASKEGGVRELGDLLSELRRTGKPFPESFAEWLAGKLGFKVDSKELENLREHLQAIDPLSLTDQASEACRVPLLSPLWILKLMREGKEGWQRYQELWRRSPSEEVKEGWRRLLEQELNEKIWLPVQPLSQELIGLLDVLTLREYKEATNNIRYEEVTKRLFQMLETVSRFYCRLGSTKGLFETMSSIFTSSLLFVPTWTNVRPPDAPLSTTSVLLGSLSALREGFTVIALDINGIQDFVFAPVKEAAASRLLRGRSLLVELVQFTASRLAIEMLGALAQFTKEGGSPTFIAPPLDAQALEKFSELLGRWMASQFMARLWVTVAASQKYNIKGALCPGEPLRVAFEELGSALAIEKSRKQAYAVDWLRKLSERKLKGLDALTREPVLEDDPWALDVSQAIDYADELAPGKLERGDVLSGLTHISLACGNVARNLVAIVSIYLFREGEPYDRDARIVAERLAKSLSEAYQERLYARSNIGGFLFDVALVPFCEVGVIHLLASLHEPELGRLQRSKVIMALLGHVLENMRGVKLESDYVHFEVRTVNAPQDFLLTEELAEELKSLGPRVGVSMLPFYTNTYHPVKFEDGKPRLVDLDEMQTIAVAFLDADGIGETTEELSKLPIALASFSDFLSLGFGAKAYACLLKKVANAGDEKPKSIILYAGGDDVSVYGAWYDVIGLLGDIGKEVLGNFLNTLTASGGISLADNKTPILHLAEVARDAERKAKRERKRRAEGGLIHIQELTTEPLKLRGGPLDLPKLACCLEEKKVKDLREFKMLIYALAELADEASKLVAKQEELNKLNEKERERIIIAKAKLVVGYKYLIARRHEDFENLKDKLRDVEIQLPSLDSNQDEVIRGLTTLKPLLDLLALRLRER